MRLVQVVCGWLLLTLSLYVLFLGWRDFTGESARMSRYISERLGISRPFWSQPGVPEMAGGSTGALVGLVLMVSGLVPPRR
ncbi:hypothetical protein SAMN05660860_00575 [Geoalkalibacter ferrihydriticus]|nr:hypothetical protein [Geoalkalibacter ferrihydriticus]SDL41604.1 hypothetical protein SAMN05660860_00575 [Geoalkalibacter ferrihydriticus]